MIPAAFEYVRVDTIQAACEALADPVLREFLPPAAADPEGTRTAAQIEVLAERIRDLVTPDSLAAAVAALRVRSARTGVD